MSYRDSIIEELKGIKNDVECVKDELEDMLDMDDIGDIKIAISSVMQDVDELVRELE